MALKSLQTLLYGVEEGIATITLHRPDKLNAFTPLMRDELIAAFDETDADDAVRAVIVTGAGRAFCAGADLSSGGQTFDYASRLEAAREELRVGDVYRDGGGLVTLRIYKSLKPVIGAINGAAGPQSWRSVWDIGKMSLSPIADQATPETCTHLRTAHTSTAKSVCPSYPLSRRSPVSNV